ncbi:unnamed protein product, partial [Laminaria digitata]
SLLAALVVASDTAMAQESDETALVVFHGGTRALDRITIEPDGESWRAVPLSRVEVIPSPQDVRVIRDARVLPDGRILLSGISDEGIGISDPDEGTFELIYRPSNAFSRIESGAVVGYTPGEDVQRILLTDSALSTASIHDRFDDRELWRASLFIPGARAFLVAGILMPGARIITASNWRSLGISGIDLFELASPPDRPAHVRFATSDHEGAPATLMILPELADLRDVMALDEDTLLVTTRFAIHAMDLDGTIQWTVSASEDLEVGGEFASARVLPSGKMVAATFEPGKWTTPHPNHRVHWYSSPLGEEAPERLATSSSLTSAPNRVLPAQSIGGTGTYQYEASLEQLNDGTLDQLQAAGAFVLDREATRAGQDLGGALTYRNTGERGVVLNRMAILAIEGERCLPSGDEPRLLWERREVVIGPLSSYTFEGTTIIDETYAPGTWCAFLVLEDREGVSFTRLSTNDTWVVLGKDGESGFTKIPRDDLSLQTRDPGMEPDPMDMGTAPDEGVIDLDQDEGKDRGCGCAQAPGA